MDSRYTNQKDKDLSENQSSTIKQVRQDEQNSGEDDSEEESMDIDNEDQNGDNLGDHLPATLPNGNLSNLLTSQRKTDETSFKQKESFVVASEFKFGSEMIPMMKEKSENDNFFKFWLRWKPVWVQHIHHLRLSLKCLCDIRNMVESPTEWVI